jgi:hypothetical protein
MKRADQMISPFFIWFVWFIYLFVYLSVCLLVCLYGRHPEFISGSRTSMAVFLFRGPEIKSG